MKRAIFVILIILFIPIACTKNSNLQKINSVKLDSISVDNSAESNHIKFVIKVEEPDDFESIMDIKKATQKSLEYFFIGLVINNDRFWVNLNPDEPSRIIDSILGNTDLGRVMLNADLRLKEDVSELVNPKTSEIGKVFWSRLREKARELQMTDRIPVMTRLWIVPAEVVAYETENQFSIVKSRLKVCLESAYLSQHMPIKDIRQKKLQDFASDLMEELLLPYLNKKVNKAYSYADLRKIFQALILAKWYKQKFGLYHDSLLKAVNFDVLKDAEINYSYGPKQIYQDYIKSLKKGRQSFTENSIQMGQFGVITTTKHYFSGGVDFRNVRIIKVDNIHQTQPREEGSYFTCDLYIPKDIERPLQYVKNQLELTPVDQEPSITLVNNLPAITPVKFAEQRIQNLDSAGIVDRLVLTKL